MGASRTSPTMHARDRSRRPGAGPAGLALPGPRGQPQAKIGLGILVFFIVLTALLAPWIAPYDPHTRGRAVYAPPSLRHPLGLRRRRDRHAVAPDRGAGGLSLDRRVRRHVRRDGDRRRHRHDRGVLRRAGPTGVLMRFTDYFLVIPDLPLAIIVAAVWGPSLSHLIFVIATPAVDDHGPDRSRSQVKSVRERVYVKRERSLGASDYADHHAPRPAPDRAAADRQHGPDGRGRDLRRDRARVPRARRTRRDHLGEHHRVRVPPDGDLVGGLVGHHPGRTVRRARDHGVLLARPGDRGRPEPPAQGRAPLAEELPAPAAPGPGGRMP